MRHYYGVRKGCGINTLWDGHEYGTVYAFDSVQAREEWLCEEEYDRCGNWVAKAIKAKDIMKYIDWRYKGYKKEAKLLWAERDGLLVYMGKVEER